jgi:hypothetical protein
MCPYWACVHVGFCLGQEIVQVRILTMGDSIIGYVHCVDNPADICTKVVPGEQNRYHLIRLLLHDLCD